MKCRTDPKTVCPELVEGLSLVCHPHTPCRAVDWIAAAVGRSAWDQLVLSFHISGAIDRLVLPAPVRNASRSDGLWQTTCVEAFAKPVGGTAYAEFNFAPSTAWAAYAFADYRQAAALPQIEAPAIDVERSDDALVVTAAVDISTLELLPAHTPWHIGLSAVIEESDGTKSYWALRHPPGPPDFHHPDCFALTLGAPDAA